MDDEELVLPSMVDYNNGEEDGLPSMAGSYKKPPAKPKLPANMNPQQVKRYFSNAGVTLTDTQTRDIAGMVSGKSMEEAQALTSNYLRPKLESSRIPSSFQPMQQEEQSMQEEYPLVAAPKKELPDFTLNTIGREIARPKSEEEINLNISQTMIDEYKAADKDLEWIFDAIDNGKIPGAEISAVGNYLGQAPLENKILGLSGAEIAKLTQPEKEQLKIAVRRNHSAKGTVDFISSYATIKALQEESTKNMFNLTTEVTKMLKDPQADKALLKKKQDELYDQIIINRVSNEVQEPFQKKQHKKDVQFASDFLDSMPAGYRAAVFLESNVEDLYGMALSLANSVAESMTGPGAFVFDDPKYNEKLKNNPDPIAVAVKQFVVNRKKELEDYKKSNPITALASEVSILDGLNAANGGHAVGQLVSSMGTVIAATYRGGPVGGFMAGYGMMFGDLKDDARLAGFEEDEAEIFAKTVAIGSGFLEYLPVQGLLKGWEREMLKNSTKQFIRSQTKAGVPKAEIINSLFKKTYESAQKALVRGIPEGTTEVLQNTQEQVTKLAFNEFVKDKEDPGFQIPTMAEFGKQSVEQFVLGMFGTGGISVAGDVISDNQSYEKIASAAIRDNEAFNNLNLVADGLLTSGKITQQQRDSFVENLKIAKEAKAAIPKYIKDDAVRQRSIELILDKKRIETDMATADPSMLDGYRARLISIQAELKSIADQKWKAPANPVLFESVAGLEAMTKALVSNSSKQNAAGTFVSTVQSGKGFISNLVSSLENSEPIPKNKVERTVNALETLAKSFSSAPVKTELTEKAAQQAQEIADQLKSYSYIEETVEEKIIPGLDISLVADRIALGVPIADLDFMGDVPADIQETYQGIMNGDEISSDDANNVQEVLYSKYNELSDVKQRIQDKLENTTSKEKQQKLTESIEAISEIQAKLGEDITMLDRYKKETRINEEATGLKPESRTKPVVKQERQQKQTQQEPTEKQGKLSEQELAEMEYDYSNPSESVTSMIDEQADASKIYKLLNNAIKFINKIAPNVKIYVHSTSQEFYDSVYSTSGANEHNLTDDAAFVMGNNGKPKAVHFNLETMLGKKDPKERAEAIRTFAHEAMHVGLHTIFGNDQKLFKSFQGKLSKVLESADLASLNDFIENYRDPNKEDVTAEEFLAELGGMMSAEGRKIPKPILSRIAQLINNTIVSAARKLKISVDPNLLFKNTNDTNDVIDFFNTMAESTRTGIVQGVQGKAEPLLKQQTKNIVTENEQVAVSRPRRTPEKEESKNINTIFEESTVKKNETARRIKEQQEIDRRPDRRVEDLPKLLESYISRSSGTRGIDKRDVRGTKRLGGLTVNTIAEYTLDNKIDEGIKKAFPDFMGVQKVYEITDGVAYKKLMINSLKDNKFAAAVTIHTPEEFNDMRMFVTEDGSTGVTITKDGFLGGAFSSPTRPKNVSQLLILGIKEGASTAECFDTILPNYYADFGFKAVSRTAFNDEYKPMVENGNTTKDWDYETFKKFNNGRPDVVFIIYDGGNRNTIEDRIGQFQVYTTVNTNKEIVEVEKANTKSFDKDGYDSAEEVMKQQAVKRLEYDIENNVNETTTTRARRSAPIEADPAKVASEQMPMSASNILYKDSEELPKPEKKVKNAAVAIELQNAAANYWGGSIVTSDDITPEQEELITNNGIQEAIDALEDNENESAANWYSTAIQVAIAVAGVIHPELVSRASAMKYEVFSKEKDPEGAARMALRMALAITSQNLNVDVNTKYAEEQFDYFKKNGRFNSKKKYGAKAPAISSNLELANTIIDKMGLNAAEEFISKGFTVADLETAFKEATGNKVKISGLRNDDVNGAAIFGPKIGQGFLQNLMGKFDPVTIDLWMRRTWGRWTGDVVGDGVTEDRMAKLYMTVTQGIKNKELNIKLPKEFKKHKPVQVKNEKGELNWTMDDKFTFDRENDLDFVAALNSISDEIRLIADNHYKNIHYIPMSKEMYAKFLSGEMSYVQASNKLKALNERQKEKYKVYAAAQKAKGLKPLAQNDKKVKDGETIKGWISLQNEKDGRTFIPTNEEISAKKPEWGNAAKNIIMDLNPIDIPSNQDRRVITRVVNNIRKGLVERGYDVTNADVQAILWYPEKDIWAKLRGEEPSNLKLSYDKQFIEIATDRGLGEQAEAVAKEIRGGGAERTSTAPDQGPNGGVRGVANAESTTRARRTQVNVTDQIAQLREQEQAENDATDPNDEAKLKEIYDRYDKLITPLLEQEKGQAEPSTRARKSTYNEYSRDNPKIIELNEEGLELEQITPNVIVDNISRLQMERANKNSRTWEVTTEVDGDVVFKGSLKAAKNYIEDENLITGKVQYREDEPTTRARRTQSSQQYYNTARATDQGTKADRDNQVKIYDKAKAFLDNFYASGGIKDDEHEALYIGLSDDGIDLNPNDLFQLRFDIKEGNRPKFGENKGGQGFAQQEGTKTRKSSVLDRIKTKLEKLGSDKSLNRKIINKLKESLHYTVQNQDDAMRIAQMVVDEFGGIDGPQDVQDLYDLSNEFSGAVKTFIVGNVLNEAYKLAKKAAKGSAEQLRYQQIINSSSSLLAERARENGREIAALYKLYLNSPEGMYTIEAKKFLQDVEAAFTDKSQKAKIDALIKELKDAKAEAARLALEVDAVRATIATATGGPVTTPPKPGKPTTPKPPKPPKPQTTPATPTQENLKKERSLFQQLKDRLKALGNTRARRQYPAGVDADVVDILAEIARVNFERGIFDFYDIKDAIAKKLAKDNMSISDAHYTEMWNDIWREAGNAQIAYNAEILAKRIVFKTKQTAPTSAPMTDPIKLIKDELFKRATQDIKDFDVENETEFDKLRRLLYHYGTMTKPIWNESKAAVERQIEALDPTKYTDAAKAELRRKLDSFFNDTIANALPRSEKKITATFAEDVKDKQLKIQDILLLPNETIASNREDFVADLVDRLVSQTGISYSDAQAITEAFTKEYDKLAQKTAEKVLARSVPRTKSKDKILKKSSAERAFEMIKYGAIDQNASLTDKDGNLTDLNDLFSDIFGLPKMNQEIRDNLKIFAEQIAKTKPNSILRQQFYNDMMSYIEFQKIRDSLAGSIILSQIYHNVLFSMDTMVKAFNSNVINMPHEFVTQAIRATFEGDFRLIPLIAKSYFGRKGEKNTEVWFKEGMNNAKLTLAGMVETENFNTTNTAEILSKQNESPALKAWGKYARKSNRFLGSIDTLFTSAATGARISDLLYDEIKYLAKQNGITLSTKQIADTVANIQGVKFTPGLGDSPVVKAIAQAKIEFTEAELDINAKRNVKLFRARVMEIVREGAKDRAAAYIVNNGWASELDGARIDEIISTAKELASKVGLVGNPPGTFGILAHFLKLPGKAMPGSQVLIGNMFANAPMNAAEKILQGNTLIGGIVLITRLLKNQRGLLNSNKATSEFYTNEGIRTEMYGRVTSTVLGRDVNMEKKEMIVRYTMLQAVLVPLSILSTTAIVGAIGKALDDDDERKEGILKDGIMAVGKISENERHMLFFGDKTAEEGSEEFNGQWKNLKTYVTGPMYGYTDPGAYSKMSAMKSMYGIEPYCVYSYGKLVTRYNDNPLLAAVFGSIGANNDVVLFNNNPEKPTETWTQQMMQSSFLQLMLVKDQAAIKPVMEIADAIGAKSSYSAPGLEDMGDRAQLLFTKKVSNLISNFFVAAEVKNFNQDMKSLQGIAGKDPREWYDFVTFRVPVIENIIRKEKTDAFDFPIEEKTKRVLPVGTQGLLYVRGADGVLQFPQVDQIMNGPGGKYYAMFKKYDNDQFDKPGIFSYVERDPNDEEGESKVKSLTLEQKNLVRDEYKKIMRQFCDDRYDELKSGISKMEFDLELDQFLANYDENESGYKDYILKKVIGENAFIDETIDEKIEDKIDEQFRIRD